MAQRLALQLNHLLQDHHTAMEAGHESGDFLKKDVCIA